jgi:uncharacterized protein
MKINDIVHGEQNIEDDVLVELINSKAFQRLKGVCQQGVPKEYIRPDQKDFSRYDHCIGTLLVLKKLDAPLEEQVAGLLHDVSHTTFSHLVDYVFGGGEEEDYQDAIHHTFCDEGTELANILEKHGLEPEKISNLGQYGLLEREQPELCADRFDYTTRYWAHMGDSKFAKLCIDSVTKNDGIMVFNSRNAAKEFAVKHTVWQPEWGGWGGTQFDMKIRWYLFGEALRIALDNGIVEKEDFMKTDAYVMEKITKANNPKIMQILGVMQRPMEFKTTDNNPKIVLKSKFRYVDPMFIDAGKVHRLSEVDGEFAGDIEAHRKLNKIGVQLESIKGIEIPINNVQS